MVLSSTPSSIPQSVRNHVRDRRLQPSPKPLSHWHGYQPLSTSGTSHGFFNDCFFHPTTLPLPYKRRNKQCHPHTLNKHHPHVTNPLNSGALECGQITDGLILSTVTCRATASIVYLTGSLSSGSFHHDTWQSGHSVVADCPLGSRFFNRVSRLCPLKTKVGTDTVYGGHDLLLPRMFWIIGSRRPLRT